MSLIIEHLEFLMRRHDCVTLPGIGAFIARYVPARFAKEDNHRLLPPARMLAFNGELREADGLLERSVSRRSGISFEAASRIVKEESESLLCQLKEFGQLQLGRLGLLTLNEGNVISFKGYPAGSWDLRFYGLKPLNLIDWEEEEAQREIRVVESPTPYIYTDDEDEEVEIPRGGSLSRRIIGVAASLAVIVTLALFLLNPIRVSNEPVKASIAPIENVEIINKEKAAPQLPDSSTISDVAIDADVRDLPADESAIGMDVETGQTNPRRGGNLQLSDNDRYCVIVASFPDANQANRYIAENSSRRLGVLNKDGKYRVFVASASTRSDAEAQRARTGQPDAWVCAVK